MVVVVSISLALCTSMAQDLRAGSIPAMLLFGDSPAAHCCKL